jgi:F0F1-type ATP synthase membrane subunit c/vacuolar-type H+-ATPase subunit K
MTCLADVMVRAARVMASSARMHYELFGHGFILVVLGQTLYFAQL